MSFEMGEIVVTKKVNSFMVDSLQFNDELENALLRYKSCDWGDLCDEDKQLNDDALESGEERIFAVYITSEGKLYIITEWDRSVTTILFWYEY